MPRTRCAWSSGEEGDGLASLEALAEQIKAGLSGDLDRGEAMLIAQATTLDALFHKLIRLAFKPDGANSHHLDMLLKLAMRAQSQSREAWKAVNSIQNPPQNNYVGQANIAHGPQQILNRPGPFAENEKSPNELLEQIDEERLDAGKTGAPGSVDSSLEAMETLDRPPNCRR